MQSLNRDHVAVSTPCCPTCMIFLRRLARKKFGNFSVLHHHSTLQLVDLPGLLPDALLQEMITMLRAYLGEQFKRLIFNTVDRRWPGLKHCSMEEDRVISKPRLTSLDGLRTVGFVFWFSWSRCFTYTHPNPLPRPVAILAHILFLEYSIQTYSSRHPLFPFVYGYAFCTNGSNSLCSPNLSPPVKSPTPWQVPPRLPRLPYVNYGKAFLDSMYSSSNPRSHPRTDLEELVHWDSSHRGSWSYTISDDQPQFNVRAFNTYGLTDDTEDTVQRIMNKLGGGFLYSR